MNQGLLSDIRANWTEAAKVITPTYRGRVLTYGPDAARLMLRSFDDLGVILESFQD